MAELLVRHGASVNVADLWKFTPLHEAAAKGKYEICKLLLKVSRRRRRRRIPGLSDQSERSVTNTSSRSHGDVPELCQLDVVYLLRHHVRTRRRGSRALLLGYGIHRAQSLFSDKQQKQS